MIDNKTDAGQAVVNQTTAPAKAHIYKDTKKPIIIAVIAIVLVLGLVVLMFFSDQFVGRAIYTAEVPGSAVVSIPDGIIEAVGERQGQVGAQIKINPLREMYGGEFTVSYDDGSFLSAEVGVGIEAVEANPVNGAGSTTFRWYSVLEPLTPVPAGAEAHIATLYFTPEDAERIAFGITDCKLNEEENCAGYIDIIPAAEFEWLREVVVCEDADGDGFDGHGEGCAEGTDCDDSDPLVNPDATEVCDDDEGLDEDCDGTANDDDPDCRECSPDETRLCYNGADGTADVGECHSGTEDCVDGSWDGVCDNEVVPGVEECNGLDDDCDGVIDNPPADGSLCAEGEVCNGVAGCSVECIPPNEMCGEECVNTDTDIEHCGSCENECVEGESCVEGGCVEEVAECIPREAMNFNRDADGVTLADVIPFEKVIGAIGAPGCGGVDDDGVVQAACSEQIRVGPINVNRHFSCDNGQYHFDDAGQVDCGAPAVCTDLFNFNRDADGVTLADVIPFEKVIGAIGAPGCGGVDDGGVVQAACSEQIRVGPINVNRHFSCDNGQYHFDDASQVDCS